VKSNRFGLPVPALVTLFSVARLMSAEVTCAGVAVVLPARKSAAAPATCGAAIEVPLIVLMAVLDVDHADVMLAPGAKMSRQVPKLEKLARASLDVVAPTVIADGSEAGEELHAFVLLLPAATAIDTPAATAPATA